MRVVTGKPFAGKIALVTGGTRGIGRAIALRLARQGAALTLVARGRERLEATAASIDGPVHVEPCDIRQRRRVEKAMTRAAGVLGPIHALVAASGIGGPNGDDDEGGDRFDDIVQTNVNGTYYCVRAMLEHLAPGPDTRHVVVLASILARIAVPQYTGYSASKAGLLGLVRSFAAELAPRGVQVNAICPGWVDTEMAWLLSPDARGVVGQAIDQNGGAWMG
jgi:3-oxoacyl-[acyl-carrier protein] reductase